MRQSLLTIVAPIALDRLSRAEAAIDRLQAEVDGAGPVGNMADLEDATGAGIHFASLHAIASPSSRSAYLLLEVSADGEDAVALARLVGGLGPSFRTVFTLASDWKDGGDVAGYLMAHRIPSGGGWFDQPGMGFVGAPGMSVGRIREDARLAAHCADLLQTPEIAGRPTALARLGALRDALARQEPRTCLLPAEPSRPWTAPSTIGLGVGLAGSFAVTYLWPLLLLDLVIAVLAGWLAARSAATWSHAATAFAATASPSAVKVGIVLLIVAIVVLGIAYRRLRAAEKTDAVDERAPDRTVNAAMFERENRCRQNHMISITVRKPGSLRSFTLRLIFWLLGRLLGSYYPPGFLGSIGTIHFARWITVPGTRDLIFLSNYDGSWESYLEDFITRAHQGITAVWSNAIGFPRSSNLFQDGATDSERFKRYARRSMVPTRFWFSAYPAITVAAIRTNAAIRSGLSGAMTEEEAASWLSLFGSAARPAPKLVSSEIQSIVFGGMGFMPFGRCLVIDRLPDDQGGARRWLAAVRPHIAFNDGRRLRRDAVATLALGPDGLKRLGLPPDGLASFPFAFVEGMAGRRRVLGDEPAGWEWGQEGADAALLVYGKSVGEVERLCGELTEASASLCMAAPHAIALEPVEEGKTEPFGFADGVSQPVIRGTYKGMRNADPIHLVEPGEFILGYPDGRGNMPPSVSMQALHDPHEILPLDGRVDGFDQNQADTPRNIGFNGSFLVIRELEQHVDDFWTYCSVEADRIRDDARFPAPYVVDHDFVAAKLIGRWRDGSSLARFPYEPRSAEKEARIAGATLRPTTRPEGDHPAIERPEPRPDRNGNGDNDFLFGSEDPEALRCPFGAHIRRANPRDSLVPGAADEVAITNRHRIIRVGRSLASRQGLLFMCLNGDIERQFEFVQQTWLRNPAFHGLACEKDPVLGDGEEGACSFTIPTRAGPVGLSPMPPFVTTRGGGYFFLPGKRLIDFLCANV